MVAKRKGTAYSLVARCAVVCGLHMGIQSWLLMQLIAPRIAVLETVDIGPYPVTSVRKRGAVQLLITRCSRMRDRVDHYKTVKDIHHRLEADVHDYFLLPKAHSAVLRSADNPTVVCSARTDQCNKEKEELLRHIVASFRVQE